MAIILVVMIGVGLAEAAGLIASLIRKLVGVSSTGHADVHHRLARRLSSVASDAGYLVLIPLGAAAFKSVGPQPARRDRRGIRGVAAGFGVNFLITPLDGVLTEITNDAAHLRRRGAPRPRREPLLRHRLDDLCHAGADVPHDARRREAARRVGPGRPRRGLGDGRGGAPDGVAGSRLPRPALGGARGPRGADRDHAPDGAPGRAAAQPRDRRHHRRLAVHGQPDRDHHAVLLRRRLPTGAAPGRSGAATT